MIGGQNTGSDGFATTCSKVGSDERTAAGEDLRNWILAAPPVLLKRQLMTNPLPIVVPTRVSQMTVLLLELLATRKVHHQEMCFQRRPTDRALEARDALPYAAAL